MFTIVLNVKTRALLSFCYFVCRGIYVERLLCCVILLSFLLLLTYDVIGINIYATIC